MKNFYWMTLTLGLGLSTAAQAKLNVVTTTSDLAVVVREVGGNEVSVDAIAKGSQDPHQIEAKPSYMVKINHADLVVAAGLELEIGWLPSILRGGRNPKVMPGSKGYLETGESVPVLEKPTGSVSRADGDVHPDGNPHFMLDPVRAGMVALKIAEKLGELDPAHAVDFKSRAQAFDKRMHEKTAAWKMRIEKSGVKSVVSYHKTLTYFFDRFGLSNPAIIEPKPGIPPTTAHILELTNFIREHKIPLVMIENFYDAKPAERIGKDVPGLRIDVVPVSVEGDTGIDSLDALYERLVSSVAGKK